MTFFGLGQVAPSKTSAMRLILCHGLDAHRDDALIGQGGYPTIPDMADMPDRFDPCSEGVASANLYRSLGWFVRANHERSSILATGRYIRCKQA